MLVVMKYRYAERLTEFLFDVEAVGGTDVFEVDATHGRLEELAEPDHILRILRAHLQVEHVDVGEGLEQNPFAFHDRLAGQRADVAEAEYRGAVRYDGDEIAFGGVEVGVVRALGDFEARLRHSRGVGEGEVPLIFERLGWRDLDLPRPALRVIIEGLLAAAGQGAEVLFWEGVMLRRRDRGCQDRVVGCNMSPMRKRPLRLRAPLFLLTLLQLGVPGAAAWADARLGEGWLAPAHIESHSSATCVRIHPADCAFHRLLVTPVASSRPPVLRIRAGHGVRWTVVTPEISHAVSTATLHDSRAPPTLS